MTNKRRNRLLKKLNAIPKELEKPYIVNYSGKKIDTLYLQLTIPKEIFEESDIDFKKELLSHKLDILSKYLKVKTIYNPNLFYYTVIGEMELINNKEVCENGSIS